MARLTSGERKGLATSQFAIPSKRAYPIDTINRGRNALARASEFASPAERAEISRKVHARYPSIGKKKKAFGSLAP